MNEPIGELVKDHEHILAMLDALETLAKRIQEPDPPLGLMQRALEFITGFADGYHHAKEEDQLFPTLVKLGVSATDGPVAVMLHEHEQGRAAVKTMQNGLKAFGAGIAPVGKKLFSQGAADYVALLRNHIFKENQILFPMAERLLGEEDTLELAQSFARIDAEVGADEKARLHQIGVELHQALLGS